MWIIEISFLNFRHFIFFVYLQRIIGVYETFGILPRRMTQGEHFSEKNMKPSSYFDVQSAGKFFKYRKNNRNKFLSLYDILLQSVSIVLLWLSWLLRLFRLRISDSMTSNKSLIWSRLTDSKISSINSICVTFIKYLEPYCFLSLPALRSKTRILSTLCIVPWFFPGHRCQSTVTWLLKTIIYHNSPVGLSDFNRKLIVIRTFDVIFDLLISFYVEYCLFVVFDLTGWKLLKSFLLGYIIEVLCCRWIPWPLRLVIP